MKFCVGDKVRVVSIEDEDWPDGLLYLYKEGIIINSFIAGGMQYEVEFDETTSDEFYGSELELV